MTFHEIFFWGCIGSMAVEVLTTLKSYICSQELPPWVQKWPFWVLRVVFMLFAGLLAAAYNVQTPILAFHIGATAPLIINQMITNNNSSYH